MRPGALWLICILLVAPMAGCLGGGDGGSEEVQEQRADVTERLGGLEGVVTDTAVQPVVGANVTLVETNQTTQTASDGSYAFSRVPPGEYTVRFETSGFVSARETATVQAGQAAVLDMILTRLSLQEPFTQQLEMTGFVECGVGWKQEAAEVVSPLLYDSALAACAVPNIYLGGNTTNDRFLHNFELEPPLHSVVYELGWDGGDTPATDPPLRTIMEVQGFINANGSRIMDVRGHSPIQVRLEQPAWEDISQNFTERCQGLNGSQENDDWCGYNFRDTGWPLVLRVFATGGCFDTPASGCLVLQQEFTHYVSAFYNQPAPEGFSVLDQG